MDGIGAVGGLLCPASGSARVARHVVKFGNCLFVAIKDRVEIDRDNVQDVKRSQWEIDVLCRITRVAGPLGSGIVETRLGAGSKVGVKICLLRLIERLLDGVDNFRGGIVGVVVCSDVILAEGLRTGLGIGDSVAALVSLLPAAYRNISLLTG